MVVEGNAGARSGDRRSRAGRSSIGGSTGYMTGFMMQKGRLVVCGDAAEAFGDSMYQGELYCGGDDRRPRLATRSLEEPTDEELAWLAETCTPFGLGPRREWRKIRSGGKLWRYDKKEFAVWREALMSDGN